MLGFAEKKLGMFEAVINAGTGSCLDLQGRCWSFDCVQLDLYVLRRKHLMQCEAMATSAALCADHAAI